MESKLSWNWNATNTKQRTKQARRRETNQNENNKEKAKSMIFCCSATSSFIVFCCFFSSRFSISVVFFSKQKMKLMLHQQHGIERNAFIWVRLWLCVWCKTLLTNNEHNEKQKEMLTTMTATKCTNNLSRAHRFDRQCVQTATIAMPREDIGQLFCLFSTQKPIISCEDYVFAIIISRDNIGAERKRNIRRLLWANFAQCAHYFQFVNK